MLLERAVNFGLIATLGVAFFSLATGYLAWTEYTSTIGNEPAWFLIFAIGLAGLAANLMFLFVVIGEYVDRKIDARGIAEP
ncbi:hypothetical protein ACFQH6_11920 [Halobacteriaceae archaeon GCM10025711]